MLNAFELNLMMGVEGGRTQGVSAELPMTEGGWGGGGGAAHERVRMAMTTAAPLRVTPMKIKV